MGKTSCELANDRAPQDLLLQIVGLEAESKIPLRNNALTRTRNTSLAFPMLISGQIFWIDRQTKTVLVTGEGKGVLVTKLRCAHIALKYGCQLVHGWRAVSKKCMDPDGWRELCKPGLEIAAARLSACSLGGVQNSGSSATQESFACAGELLAEDPTYPPQTFWWGKNSLFFPPAEFDCLTWLTSQIHYKALLWFGCSVAPWVGFWDYFLPTD